MLMDGKSNPPHQQPNNNQRQFNLALFLSSYSLPHGSRRLFEFHSSPKFVMGCHSAGVPSNTPGLRERNVSSSRKSRCFVQDTLIEKKKETEKKTFGRTPDGTGEPIVFSLFTFLQRPSDLICFNAPHSAMRFTDIDWSTLDKRASLGPGCDRLKLAEGPIWARRSN
jgi:hypothetical protein